MTIAVVGATGHLGRLTVSALRERDVPADQIHALGRDRAKLAELGEQGVATFAIDLDDPATLTDALRDVEDVLLISSSEVGRRVPQHRAAVDAAVAAGARRVVYTSAPQATTSPLVLAPEHKATEELLAASGLVTTILRNSWYTENHRPEFDGARATGTIANSVGARRIASAPRADFAEAAAVVLTTGGHDGAVCELSGDAAWSYEEFAETAARVLGRPVTYQPITPDQERENLLAAGLPPAIVDMLVAINGGARDGLLSLVTDDLARLLGRPTTPLEDTLRTWV